MRNSKILTKIVSGLLTVSLTMGVMTGLSGCGNNNSKDVSSSQNETVTLTVFSQLANYSGEQIGWMADVLKDKFNVKLNIIPDEDGVLQSRMESKNLGDIVIWGDSDQYAQAVKAGLLYDLEEDDLIQTYGKDITENMSEALDKNKDLTADIMEDDSDHTLYGWGNDIGTSRDQHAAFMYSWDIRWDLYKKLGYPEVKDLNDLMDVLKKMQKINSKDDSGKKTYGVSMWPDWDGTMAMYVKSMASAYYGCDELGVGLYDPKTGEYHDALEENGPYLEMMKFFNTMYREGLVDPDSMTQTYDQMTEKVQNGGVLFSIFNYAGSLGFNSTKHLKEGQYMYTMKPEDASPIVYGLNPQGSNYVTSIGANTEYPELCMEILDYFCTPEGRMVMSYGPKGECWDYDDNNNVYFTKLGKECYTNGKTKMKGHKGTFQDGQMQMAVSTWATDSVNPESNGDTYNADNWKTNSEGKKYDIEKDWMKKTGSDNLNDYLEKGKYTVAPGTSYTASTKSEELKAVWKQVSTAICNGTWNAIYAKSDSEFDKIVSDMIKSVDGYGYDKCLDWSKKEADRRHKLELEVADK